VAIPAPQQDDGFRQRYLDALKFLQQTQAPMGPEPVEPTAPKETFLQNAAGPMAAVLGNIRPARLPGAGHQAANILSALAQIYGGAQQNMLEQKRKDYSTQAAQYRADMAERRKQQMAGPEKLRQSMAEQIAAPPKPTPQGTRMVVLTPERYAEATANHIFLPKSLIGEEVPLTSLIRDLPATDTETRDLLNQQRREAIAQAQERAASEEANIRDTAQQIADFRIGPSTLSNRDPKYTNRIKTMVNDILRERGSNLSYQYLEKADREMLDFQRTQNSQRFVNLRQSAMTVRQHLDQFKAFYKDYFDTFEKLKRARPLEVRLWNKGLLSAAKNGFMGPEAAERAASLETTADALSNEMPVVLSGGYAPHLEQTKRADNMVSMLLGPRGNKGRISALEKLLDARIKNATSSVPYFANNPYLKDVNPLSGWGESKVDMNVPSDPNKKGVSTRYE